MPYGNGTGPMGQGPMTGRGMGPCGRGGRRGFFGRAGYGGGYGAGYGGWVPTREITVDDLEAERDAIKQELAALEKEIKASKKPEK